MKETRTQAIACRLAGGPYPARRRRRASHEGFLGWGPTRRQPCCGMWGRALPPLGLSLGLFLCELRAVNLSASGSGCSGGQKPQRLPGSGTVCSCLGTRNPLKVRRLLRELPVGCGGSVPSRPFCPTAPSGWWPITLSSALASRMTPGLGTTTRPTSPAGVPESKTPSGGGRAPLWAFAEGSCPSQRPWETEVTPPHTRCRIALSTFSQLALPGTEKHRLETLQVALALGICCGVSPRCGFQTKFSPFLVSASRLGGLVSE